MKNSITAHIEFSFKGETHALTSQLDLDALLSGNKILPSLYEFFAREHHIDTISYLYEVMQVADFEFSNAQGLAANFLRGSDFDAAGFASLWQEQQIVTLLQPIAKRELNIDDLTQQTNIKNALVQAYKLGKGL